MNLLKKTFYRDSYLFGILLALVSPVIFLYVVYCFIIFLSNVMKFRYYDIQELYLLGLAINVWWIRYYLVKTKLIKTGHSVVAVSFIEMIIFFIFN
jgi:hypothetical protein